MKELEQKLQVYLRRKLDQPNLVVSGLARIPGGASRETYRFRATSKGNERGLILRRDPPASLIETERDEGLLGLGAANLGAATNPILGIPGLFEEASRRSFTMPSRSAAAQRINSKGHLEIGGVASIHHGWIWSAYSRA